MTGSRRTFPRLAVVALIASAPAYSQQFFSHAVLNIPEVRVDAPWVQVIETQEEWTAFYLGHFGSDTASVVVPAINFSQYRIVAGGLGYQPMGGGMLAFERIADGGNAIYVVGAIVSYGAGCLVGAMVTWPTTAVMIPQSEKPVRMSMVRAVHDCE